jgi:hypothetical protein
MEPNNPFRFLASHMFAGSAGRGKLIAAERDRHPRQHGRQPKKRLITLAAALLLVATLAAPALAGDNKVYSGSTCKPTTETGATGMFYGNNATNLGGANVNVVCPVVREVTAGGTPNAYVDVNSNAVTCTFVTTNANGLGTFDSGTAAPVLLVAGVYRIDIQGVGQVGQGAYHIDCTLPPATAVLRYSVAE